MDLEMLPLSREASRHLIELIGEAYDLKVSHVRLLPGEFDDNFYLETDTRAAYLLKIAHPDTDPGYLDLQNGMLRHLARRKPNLLLPRVLANRQEKYITRADWNGRSRQLRLLTWVPGRLLASVNPHGEGLLNSLGQKLGQLSQGLQKFDHPAAHRYHKWDVSNAGRVAEQLHYLDDESQRALVQYFLGLFREQVAPRLETLRHSVNYNDANDYNILVRKEPEAPRVVSFIDFGDAVYTATINELAIALAYTLMDKADPLAAAVPVIRSYHREFPLREEELDLLYPLIGARLVLSVVTSAINQKEEPENEYLQISARPAWTLLEKWAGLSPAFARCTFRWACGLEPHPLAGRFRDWARTKSFAPVMGRSLSGEEVTPLDLSVSSLDLGNHAQFTSPERFERKIRELLDEADASVGIGGYGEVRPFYSTDNYVVSGNEGPQWRTVHLGLDIWMPAGSPVYAPLGGTVQSVRDNRGARNYGPTVILKHEVDPELTFYTLYGHLSRASLKALSPGQEIEAGASFASLGPRPENGNWPPHLHFQVILDLLGLEGDFPGVGFHHLQEVWTSICPDPAHLTDLAPAGLEEVDQARQALAKQRKKHLSPNLSLSYRYPLHIVRGYQQYLYDETARRYLDTVNNVAHVGHEHPRIVRAGQRQMAVLNTNTRYLHSQIGAYAEELLAHFPAGLEVLFFVNSGSEANDLALRLARTYTRQRDVIAIQAGYHGHTAACIDVSSYKFDGKGGSGAPTHTHVVPMPDIFRGKFRTETAGADYAKTIDRVIKQLKSQGRRPAGFIGESILSCGGQVVLPEKYLQEVYRMVRAAGGLCIADEVQTGFGRPGDHFWAFEMHGVVPDIVTLGKPIGNGHPLGAVVTSRAVADRFQNGMEYFNTYGGNPVSCAIGREVLAVIAEEKLQENARTTGSYLRQQLLELQTRHPLIGEVRGPGLFQGIELVRDRDKRTPAPQEAAYLINRIRRHGILMSTDGPQENVIKIKPPMCFTPENVDFLVETLDNVLREDALTL